MRNVKIATSVLVTAFLFAAVGAGQAAAAPAWDLEIEAPNRLAPGEEFRYQVRARNVGDEATDATGAIDFVVPDGIEVIGDSSENAGPGGIPWECGDLSATSIHCTYKPVFGPVVPRSRSSLSFTAETEPDVSGTPTAGATISGGGAVFPDSAEHTILKISSVPEFGVADWRVHIPPDEEGRLQAGSHPDSLAGSFELNTSNAIDFSTEAGPGGETILVPEPIILPDGGGLRDLFADAPPGFVGSPAGIPTCDSGDLVPSTYAPLLSPPGMVPACPIDSIVGTVSTKFSGTVITNPVVAPIFNMKPPPGSPAAFGFNYESLAIQLTVNVRTDGDLGVTVQSLNTSQAIAALASRVTFWGIPADPSHDFQRCQWYSAVVGSGFDACTGEAGDVATGPNPAGVPPKPFLTLPTSCTEPGKGLGFGLRAESWKQPAGFGSAFAETTEDPEGEGAPIGTTGCDRVPFQPRFEVQPTTDEAETPTGLEAVLTIPSDGINNPEGISQSHLKDTTVTLPEGMTVNPSPAEGLEVCTPEQVGLRSGDAQSIRFNKAKPSCPDASQIGEILVDTPLLEESLPGRAYLAQEEDSSAPGAENPFNSTLALYLVIEGSGLLVKLAGEIAPDPRTGQLVVSFLDNPEVPFSRFSLKFKGGQRAPLAMPSVCGTHTTKAELSPWARPDETVTVTDSFQITKGPNGGPCPSGGVPPFKPGFSAGSINNKAASHTSFNMRVLRGDGEQDMTRFSAILPPGVLGKLAGVDKCPDSAISIAQSKTGRQEIASPSCPANSQIGTSTVGAGVGSILSWVPGKIYLGGPVKGDPLSVIAITPVVAGPFDVGTVVVREALTLDPVTAEVEVDGEASDPIPHILKGIPAKLRDLRVQIDRDKFIINPTSCAESSVKATLFGSYLDVIDPSDDKPVSLSARFQAAECTALGFKPKLNLTLKGGTKRGGHPGLKALYRPRKGDANVKGLVVRLPKSAFLDQAHIRTICTRIQFAADSCPKGAQYGYIKAWTPLLEEPLQGPVWLRSSNHKLPDLVFDLHGLVDIEVSTRIDSARGGIRATVEDTPDAPLSKVLLRMQGAKKGLIINSRNLCGAKSRAEVGFTGQNGKRHVSNPVMQADCGGKGKAKKR